MTFVHTTVVVSGITTEWLCHPRAGFLLTHQEIFITMYFETLKAQLAQQQRWLYGNRFAQLHKKFNWEVMGLRLVCKRWFVLLSQLYLPQEEKAQKGAMLHLSLQAERF